MSSYALGRLNETPWSGMNTIEADNHVQALVAAKNALDEWGGPPIGFSIEDSYLLHIVEPGKYVPVARVDKFWAYPEEQAYKPGDWI